MNLDLIKEKYFVPKNVLDIGANVGQFYILCKNTFPKADILSIEGNILCAKPLSLINPNYLIKLLDAEPRIRKFFLNKNNLLSTGSSIYKELSEHFNFENSKCVNVKTTNLDKLLPYQVFDLVKIDTQGSELDILIGGEKLLKRTKGVIIEVSHKPYNLNAPLSYKVVNFMLEQNFLLKETLDSNKSLHQSDFFFVNEWWYEYYAKIIQE